VVKEYLDGAEAVVRGALDSGCDFFAGYPITPSSAILVRMMRELPRRGAVAVQGEDEIASLGMCIAAAMTGRRVLTATSGPGISLYSENLGLAIMGEVPLVIVNVQRLGPATGGATTGAEGDVQFVQWGTSGGLPMVVLTPTDVATSYWLTTIAFQVAEKLRIPVIINTSKDLIQTMETVDVEAWRREPVKPRTAYQGGAPYLPYAYKKPTDIPEFLPVGADIQVRFTTSMHDERALLSKDPKEVQRLFDHLNDKIMERRSELTWVQEDFEPGAETLIVASGVSARSAKAAVDEVRAAGGKVNLLTLYTVWPVPEEALLKAAAGMKKIVVPELNLGLYAREIERVLAGLEVVRVNRIDGELLETRQIIEEGGLR
jgi:2-oxoglutarate/2-oxoacid ferredoxin oxidoreductase subunit alpha